MAFTMSEYEAYSYYAGISRSPPKLVYRTSKDPFVRPSLPEAYRRLICLYPVFNHRLGEKWEDVRPKICAALDKKQVRISSIDLVRFRTVRDAAIGPVVIWVGVLPDSLTSEDAVESANAILALLDNEGISDVDVEYRESVIKRTVGAEFYRPASDEDPLRYVTDPLTTSLGLPIASAEKPSNQGTLGFYFKDGDDLYGVTARHVLFDDNLDYNYHPSSPRRDVLLMGTKAWDHYLESIETHIRVLGHLSESYSSSRQADDDTPPTEDEIKDERTLLEMTVAIEKLRALSKQTEKDFGEPKQRVLGYIAWAPPITYNTDPHGFTKDFCVIKLDKDRFLPNFEGNTIDLGIDISEHKFLELMHPRADTPSGFRYPEDRLFRLNGILTEDHMRHPKMPSLKDVDKKYNFVIKRGLTSLTTIGRATGSYSQVREHFADGTHRDSVEWAILPYDVKLGVFSEDGDSGSIIATSTGEYGGLLTGGSGMKGQESSDITYATPMFWLWPVIKEKFPNADLIPVFT